MISALLLALAVGWIYVIYVPRVRATLQVRRQRQAMRVKRPRFRAEIDMGLMLTEVATRLRSGAAVGQAWEKTLAHQLSDSGGAEFGAGTKSGRKTGVKSGGKAGVANSLDEQGVPTLLRALWQAHWWQRRQFKMSKVGRAALPATFAVCRLGAATGAPMAEIFDSCAVGIVEAGEAHSAREVALAGPQTSAYMLSVLPLIGLALGFVLGVNPFDFLLGSAWGHLALAAALAFELGGFFWVRALVAKARREVDEK